MFGYARQVYRRIQIYVEGSQGALITAHRPASWQLLAHRVLDERVRRVEIADDRIAYTISTPQRPPARHTGTSEQTLITPEIRARTDAIPANKIPHRPRGHQSPAVDILSDEGEPFTLPDVYLVPRNLFYFMPSRSRTPGCAE